MSHLQHAFETLLDLIDNGIEMARALKIVSRQFKVPEDRLKRLYDSY